MADEVGGGRGPDPHGDEPHLPSPTIWPVGFAVGVALVLIGLVITSWAVVAVGAGLGLVFAFLWIRDVTREVRGVPEPEPEPEAEPLDAGIDASQEEEVARFPRSRFLEGATLGIGAAIGGAVTLPAVGFMVAPAFIGQEYEDIDVGPLDNFPEGSWIIVNFPSNPTGDRSGVSRRTAYIRNNGRVNGAPSLTILSNRCVHLGCPVQPAGPLQERQEVETSSGTIALQPTQPAGFGCPCHGGAYNTEGNRTAGPPVRALDRYKYAIKDGNVVLGTPYSVSFVEGEGADARIHAYDLADPSVHLDGPEQVFYPFTP